MACLHWLSHLLTRFGFEPKPRTTFASWAVRTVRIRIVYCLFTGHAARFYIWLNILRPRTVHHFGANSCPGIPATAEICLLETELGDWAPDWALWRLLPLSSIKFYSIISHTAGKLCGIVSLWANAWNIYSYDRDGIMTSPPRHLTSIWDVGRPLNHELWPGIDVGQGLIAALISDIY